jgi:organic hydroperoxide reductase OsmC/OhrA
VLAPKVAFSGERLPDTAEIAALHERAHHDCFIANSIRTEVTVEAQD